MTNNIKRTGYKKLLTTKVTPGDEITENKLVIIHITAPHALCPVCHERNTLSKEFWQTIIAQGLNDVPGYCPVCTSLYTIRINEQPKAKLIQTSFVKNERVLAGI